MYYQIKDNQLIISTHNISELIEVKDLSDDVIRFPKVVNEKVVLDTEAKEKFDQAAIVYEQGINKLKIKSKIENLEKSTYRTLRELALGLNTISNIDRLQKIENEIQELRNSL